MASATSVYMPVREKLVELQQELARKTNVIMDGRDIGTVVLPQADVKYFSLRHRSPVPAAVSWSWKAGAKRLILKLSCEIFSSGMNRTGIARLHRCARRRTQSFWTPPG